MSCFRLPLVAIFSLLAVIPACTRQEPADNVTKTQPVTAAKSSTPVAEGQLRIALGGMITPKEGLAYYHELLDFIGAQLGRSIEYVDAESYKEINDKLETGELDAAFVCSGPYVSGKKKFNLELVAAPQAYGHPEYYSYFIVPKDSTAKQLSDLKGKMFAFTDPISNTGKFVPEYMLLRMGARPATFFSKTFYSGSHDQSIKAVAEGLVDGAAVDSLIWDYLHRKHPEKTAGTRILYKSSAYASPPFVVRPGLDPSLKARLRKILLNVHNSPEGRAILDKMYIDCFVPVEDNAYASVREVMQWVEKSRTKGPEN